jgi:hypothetical protein
MGHASTYDESKSGLHSLHGQLYLLFPESTGIQLWWSIVPKVSVLLLDSQHGHESHQDEYQLRDPPVAFG